MARVEKMLGRQIALHRRAAGLTQANLAEKLGVADETISRLERGAVVPPINRIAQIAAALGVEIVDLFRYSGRGSERDIAIERMVSTLVDCAPRDVDLLTEVARLILGHFTRSGKRSRKLAQRSVAAGCTARRLRR